MELELDTEQKAEQARELCEKGLWPEALAFAQTWHAENPARTQKFRRFKPASRAKTLDARRVQPHPRRVCSPDFRFRV